MTSISKIFIQYSLFHIISFLLTGCYTNSKISTFVNLNRIGVWDNTYDISIEETIKYTSNTTKDISYYSDDGKHVKYLDVRLKIRNSYMRIYPDYSELSYIHLPAKGKKIDTSILQKYKPARVTYYLNGRIYDCVEEKYFINSNEK